VSSEHPRCTYCPLPATCITAELAFREYLCGLCCSTHDAPAIRTHIAAEGVDV